MMDKTGHEGNIMEHIWPVTQLAFHNLRLLTEILIQYFNSFCAQFIISKVKMVGTPGGGGYGIDLNTKQVLRPSSPYFYYQNPSKALDSVCIPS